MEQLLSKFSWDAAKFTRPMFVCTVVIWLMVVGCALHSIWHQPFTRRQRLFWVLLLIGVPVLGLLVYLPFSFRKENDPGLAILFPGGIRSRKN
jgi:phage shock protein PspC (stress-responsive transcriptional regulator)